MHIMIAKINEKNYIQKFKVAINIANQMNFVTYFGSLNFLTYLVAVDFNYKLLRALASCIIHSM